MASPDTLWRIEELTTEGWTLISDRAKQLNKAECDKQLEEYLQTGTSAPRLRAVPDTGTSYQTPKE